MESQPQRQRLLQSRKTMISPDYVSYIRRCCYHTFNSEGREGREGKRKEGEGRGSEGKGGEGGKRREGKEGSGS